MEYLDNVTSDATLSTITRQIFTDANVTLSTIRNTTLARIALELLAINNLTWLIHGVTQMSLITRCTNRSPISYGSQRLTRTLCAVSIIFRYRECE